MVSEAERVERLLSRRRIRRSDTIVLVLAALALATGVGAWIADADQATALTSAALPGNSEATSFDDRFASGSSVVAKSSLAGLDVSALTLRQTMLRGAKDDLTAHLASGDWRSVPDDEATRATAVVVPLPRSRPVAADQSGRITSVTDAAPAQDSRTLLQKISDLFPAKIKLASLTPDSGLFSRGPDLAALGYDHQTAVYDISARAVYLRGTNLRAQSQLRSVCLARCREIGQDGLGGRGADC